MRSRAAAVGGCRDSMRRRRRTHSAIETACAPGAALRCRPGALSCALPLKPTSRLAQPARALGAPRSPASPGSARRSISSGSTSSLNVPPRDPEDAAKASAASCGRCTAAASITRRSTASRPRELPEPLHWFKWEAYWTWISGFALLVVIYYAERRSSTDRSGTWPISAGRRRSRIEPRAAVARGWLVYDRLCAARLRAATTRGARRRAACSSLLLGLSRQRVQRARRLSCRSARCSARSWWRTCSS